MVVAIQYDGDQRSDKPPHLYNHCIRPYILSDDFVNITCCYALNVPSQLYNLMLRKVEEGNRKIRQGLTTALIACFCNVV